IGRVLDLQDRVRRLGIVLVGVGDVGLPFRLRRELRARGDGESDEETGGELAHAGSFGRLYGASCPETRAASRDFAVQQKACSLTVMSRDKPWIFRTYAGHSSAAASNALYRTNLAKGQTGLSVAFDLPTQTGYDSDDAPAKGEVGKVGVPISHLGD